MKGLDVVFGRNLMHLGMASNDAFMNALDVGDRRGASLPISSKRAGDNVYGKKVKDAIYGGEAEAFMYDMLKRDLTGYDSFSLPPVQSEMRHTLQLKSGTPMIRFIQQLLDEGDVNGVGSTNGMYR